MKLMLRPEWRLWPLSSFLGLLDLKTGVTVALLFALLNKVAGVYGLIAVLTGAGGSFAQLSLYIYSAIALVALAWGLRAVKEEDPKQTLYFAHLFFADHVLSTSWTVFFALVWWLWTPHDGQRQASSAAQKQIMESGNITMHHLSDAERAEAAMTIWNHEKGMAAAVIIISWLSKIYFTMLIYSYATHLRKGSYRSLPLSRSTYATSGSTVNGAAYDTALAAEEDEEIEDFYRVPLRTPTSGHRRSTSHTQNGSISSFTDFMSAPGRQPRKSKLGPSRDIGIEEEVLFDEDDLTAYAPSSSSRGHSKLGTETSSTAASTDEERAVGGYSDASGKGKATRVD
ncbi:Inositolphosphorylceramide synthase subunit Kei1-domain-containing protein [Crucibulum laeve]|uniref:Inositolphosphorylceramide synthase subunit Kei1-domain-containing protein n=1 Tax=Crucibulum laeve TaxID=68775 RepID=A0A5C3M5D3_9AGAR|nr:Inositolphosphorylceramide synthase subunit Kei1-domain-containing protein [Crucibulum laeve]